MCEPEGENTEFLWVFVKSKNSWSGVGRSIYRGIKGEVSALSLGVISSAGAETALNSINATALSAL